MEIYETTKGDTRWPMQCQAKDSAGDPIDITGYTYTLNYDKNGTTVTKTATITNEVLGQFEFTFVDEDVDTDGTFKAQIVEDDGAGKDDTWPIFYIRFKPEIS